MPSKLDLQLISTPELVEELASRHQASVFTAINFEEDIATFLHGSSLLCSGLLTNAMNEILWASFKERPSQ